MYYSSGIDFVYNDDCNQIKIKVVRQRINTISNPMSHSVISKYVVDSVESKELGIVCYIVEIPIEEHWSLDNACDRKIVKIEN